jgi:DNA polymerase-3 subunit alpha
MNFISLHNHSHFSLLDGLAKPSQIAKRCSELGQSACAITDHGSVSGAVNFHQECTKHGVKPILGIEAYVTESSSTLKDIDNTVRHQVILAKNLKGWLQLVQLVSASNDEERYYYRPRIDLELLQELSGDNLISFSGHMGSTLTFDGRDLKTIENYALLMQEIFGKGNFFLEVQLIDDSLQNQTDQIRQLSQLTKIPCVATGDTHYCQPEDAVDHQVLLCSALKTTFRQIRKDIQTGTCKFSTFFKSNNFYLPDLDYMISCGHKDEEINNTSVISDMCEPYDITGPPVLPHFKCPNDLSETSYLRQLCRDGWKSKIDDQWDIDTYANRVKTELDVIDKAGLAGYFLIVQDYVNWAKNQGWLIGPARGSVAGSLVSFLLNITIIDPIKYNLIFERFYDSSRAGSLPDIDIDFPKYKRNQLIEYLQQTYGQDKVCQMATFGRLQGRGAIKEVLRVHNACDFETMNVISKALPREDSISDQLEESGEESIIRWTLQNDPDDLADWCRLNSDGNLSGEYAQFFAQAIRLEGTYKSQGKHAAGIVLSAQPLDKVCPMIRDKNSDNKIAGLPMDDLEKMGHTKFDILATAALDKLEAVNQLLMTGTIE